MVRNYEDNQQGIKIIQDGSKIDQVSNIKGITIFLILTSYS